MVGNGVDLREGVAQLADPLGERRDRVLDLIRVVDVARVGDEQLSELLRLQIRHSGLEHNGAKVVALPFLNREGDHEPAAVWGQLGDRRADVEVGVTARQVEAAEQLLIECDAIGVVGVVCGEKPVPGRLFGLDHIAQIAVVELPIADEYDARHLGERAFIDLENQIDAILGQFDDLGLDRRRKAAIAAVQLEDSADRVLHPRARVNHARAKLDLRLQHVVLEPTIAFECNTVDDRILGHRDHQGVAVAAQRYVIE